MRKLLYMTRLNTDAPENSGVLKKVLAQLNAFRNNGWDASLCKVNTKGLYVNSLLLRSFESGTKLKNYYYHYYHSLITHLEKQAYDIIYIRFFLSDFLFLGFLKSVRRVCPNCKIILELPTYPYNSEHSALSDKIRYAMDAWCNRFLKKYISKIITYSKDDSIFGIPTIQSANGIEMGHEVERQPSATHHIEMIAIANLSEWHAFDRMLKGMDQFKKRHPDSPYSFTFHVVGSGKVFNDLKSLCSTLLLENEVVFHGNRNLADISELLSKANLAVGTLGLHRIGIEEGSTLKSREYCAMGIPFVISSNDRDFPKELSFVKYVPSGEMPLDMDDLTGYYESIKEQQVQLAAQMRQYAKDHLTWDIKIKEILEKLNDD